MNKQKLRKYVEYGLTKIKLLYKEKKHHHEGSRVKYMLDKYDNSKDLIIVFSGMTRPGVKARYNNNRTLKNVKANRLFILDDLGYDGRGGYYIGKNKDFFMEKAVVDLINKIKKDFAINRTIYSGSSKGGWAALYFGIRDNGSSIIAGSLQYRLADFVSESKYGNYRLMEYIMGENYNDKDVEYLNELLRDTLTKHQNNDCDIHLHYSESEYTYKEHMVYLLNDLKELGFKYTEDIKHYEDHWDLSLNYPPFLLRKVNEILESHSVHTAT